MQHLKKQLEETQEALRIEQRGGNNIGKKYEKRIQQLLLVRAGDNVLEPLSRKSCLAPKI